MTLEIQKEPQLNVAHRNICAQKHLLQKDAKATRSAELCIYCTTQNRFFINRAHRLELRVSGATASGRQRRACAHRCASRLAELVSRILAVAADASGIFSHLGMDTSGDGSMHKQDAAHRSEGMCLAAAPTAPHGGGKKSYTLPSLPSRSI